MRPETARAGKDENCRQNHPGPAQCLRLQKVRPVNGHAAEKQQIQPAVQQRQNNYASDEAQQLQAHGDEHPKQKTAPCTAHRQRLLVAAGEIIQRKNNAEHHQHDRCKYSAKGKILLLMSEIHDTQAKRLAKQPGSAQNSQRLPQAVPVEQEFPFDRF